VWCVMCDVCVCDVCVCVSPYENKQK